LETTLFLKQKLAYTGKYDNSSICGSGLILLGQYYFKVQSRLIQQH